MEGDTGIVVRAIGTAMSLVRTEVAAAQAAAAAAAQQKEKEKEAKE